MSGLSILYNKPIWVCWKKKQLKEGKTTKIPMGIGGKPASSTNPNTWMTYSKAQNLKTAYKYDGVGVVFGQDKQILGVDLDNVLLDGDLYTGVKNFVEKSNTYTEISPSGKGIHLYFFLTDSFTLEANKHKVSKEIGYEIYNSGRFFTVTEKPYKSDKPIRAISSKEMFELLKLLGYPFNKGTNVSQANSFSLPFLSDDLVLQRAFQSKVGNKIKALYDGDLSEYNNDTSAGDLAFCSYVSFFCGSTIQTERIWMSSPLGSRDKVQNRADYRERTISKAFSNKTVFYDPKEISDSITISRAKGLDNRNELEKLDLIRDNSGLVIQENVHNIAKILSDHPIYKDRIKLNLFNSAIYIDGRTVTDTDFISIQAEFQKNFQTEHQLKRVGKKMIMDSVILASSQKTFHPVREWLESLEWDGEERLFHWIDTVCGEPEEDSPSFYEYRSNVGTNTIKAMVARIFDPGCKYDYIFVLEGDQGCGKSTLLSTLATPQYRLETNTGVDKKDFFMDTAGKWIVELAEGETLARSSVASIKAMASRQVDTFRKPYGFVSEDVPRQFILAMTTNETIYLKDQTGNRRFLPIKVNLDFIDIKWLLENREQLFAEAVQEYRTNPSFNFLESETKIQQLKRAEQDILREEIEIAWDSLPERVRKEEGVTSYELWERLERSNYVSTPQTWEISKIGRILREMGLDQKRITKEVGDTKRRTRCWIETRL